MKKIFGYLFCGSLLFLTGACGRNGQLTLEATDSSTQTQVDSPVVVETTKDTVVEENVEEVVEASPAAEEDLNHPYLHAVETPKFQLGPVTSPWELAPQNDEDQPGLDLVPVKEQGCISDLQVVVGLNNPNHEYEKSAEAEKDAPTLKPIQETVFQSNSPHFFEN